MEHLLRDVKDTTISTLATEVLILLSLSLCARLCVHFIFYISCFILLINKNYTVVLYEKEKSGKQDLSLLLSSAGDWETGSTEGVGCPT